jgi:hypothetical protein
MRKKLLSLLALALCTASNMWALNQVDDVYQIGTAQDLADFATIVNGGEYGASAVLTANINMSEDWTTPIGSESNPYTGTFDGQGFTISNFTYTTTANNTGFFGNLGNGAVVKNFTIEGSINSTKQRVGVIGSVGSSSSVETDITTISNIHSKITLTCTQTRHGGVVGAQNGAGTLNIDCCTYSGTFTVTTNVAGNFGGIIGLTQNANNSHVNITNCLFDGEISVSSGDNDTNAGGIVGYTRQSYCKIENCLSVGTITATTPGQFVGQINATSHMSFAGSNYYTEGNVQGTGTGAPVSGSTTPEKITDLDILTSGELCYLLNGSVSGGTNWYQTLPGDANPTLDSTHGLVYVNGTVCPDTGAPQGTVSYSNAEGTTVGSHVPVDGFCTYCGILDATYMTPVDGYYEIGTPAQLKWFSAWVNSSSDNISSNAVLTDDIDMTSIAATWVPIGDWNTGNVNSAYKGHFNGQGHEISNFNVTTSQTYYGIFGVVSAATIENFSIKGTIINEGNYSNIGVIGYSRDTSVNIQDIQSYLTITNKANDKNVGGILGSGNAGTTNINRCVFFGTINADNKTNAGGIVGYFRNNPDAIVNITNCLFDGTISSEISNAYCGGIAGYGGNSVSNVKINNCLSLGTINAPVNGQFFGNIRNTGSSITNCYYQGDNINGTGSSTLTTVEATPVTDIQLSSGEVCYLLNGDQTAIAWYQTIGTNEEPTLDATNARVYVNGTVCPDTGAPQGTVSYSNTPGTTVGTHNYVDGFCSYCDLLDATYMTPVDGYYEIGNEKQLKWFAAFVNEGNPAVNGKLTADIDLDGVTWTPIGNGSNKYTGTFDGQGFSILNFSYTATGNDNGLFGYVRNATIKNFSISGTLTSIGYTRNGTIGAAEASSVISGIHSALNINVSNISAHTGGILGSTITQNNLVLVESCEYSGTLTHNGDGDCQAGILGYTYDGGVKNCIFSGTIIGEASKYGGILGYCKIPSFLGVQNCLSIGKIQANDGNTTAAAIIANWNGGTTANVKNNYYKLQEGSTTTIAIGNKASNCEAPIEVTTEQLASGYVTAKLGYAFHQNLGSDAIPTLDKTKGYVTQIGAAGYSTQYITDSDVTIPSGVEAFAGVVNESSIILNSISGAIAVGEPVVLRGDAGFYNFMPTTGATPAASNDLQGSDGTTKGGDGIYALAKKDDVVGFYPVDSEVTIPAGKAYLNTTAGGVKGFYGFEDNATSINEELRMKSEESSIYNVAGQRLIKMQKGINIVNGKKVAIK